MPDTAVFRQTMVEGACLAMLGVRIGVDRVIPLTLGIWGLGAHIPAATRWLDQRQRIRGSETVGFVTLKAALTRWRELQ